MASIDIRSSAGQTDMDVGDLDSTFRGPAEYAIGERCAETSNFASFLPPLFLQLSVTIKKNGKVIATTNIKTLPTCFYDLYVISSKNEDPCTSSKPSKSSQGAA